MSTECDQEKGLDLRSVGMTLCLVSIVASVVASVFCMGFSLDKPIDIVGILFFTAFQLPVPVIAFFMFRGKGKQRRVAHVHTLAALIPYVILMEWFWCIAPEEAVKDAQGGLIFVFGPIYIQMFSLFCMGSFSLGYFIFRRVRRNS